jgi:thiol-disulfide isomerase/thioredoxin
MSNMKSKQPFQAMVLTLFFLLAWSGVACSGVQMPAFALNSVVDGKKVSSEEFKGQALLITFFATWCPPCRQEIPTLIKLQNEFKDQGFSVIGLSVDQGGPNLVAKLVAQEKINYPVLMSNRPVERGFGGVAGVPTSFLVNKKGDVVRRYPGYVPHVLLKKDIEGVMR